MANKDENPNNLTKVDPTREVRLPGKDESLPGKEGASRPDKKSEVLKMLTCLFYRKS